MTYKGYTAKIHYSDDDDCLVGRVIGIRHIISFHGDSIEEIRQAFRGAIDFYLSTEPTPEKPFSGKFNVRISSERHAKAAQIAESTGISLNQLVDDAIGKAIEEAEGRKTGTFAGIAPIRLDHPYAHTILVGSRSTEASTSSNIQTLSEPFPVRS